MAMKKQNPAVAKRVADRKAFVKDKVASKGITAKQARQRFYVQTRMAEMKAAGKTVSPEMRKQLQQKFQSGNVSRAGFAAPKKSSGSSASAKPKMVGDQPVRAGVGSKATVAPKATGAVASKGQAIRQADAASASKRRTSGTTRAKGKY
jgi:hypothetical protein